MSKEVIKKEENAMFAVEMDETALAMMNEDSETYVDETSAEDISIPRIKILQSGSKQVKKADPLYIKGAEEGDVFNTLSEEVVPGDEGIFFVPVKRRHSYVEWRDVDSGGGIVQNFGEDSTAYNKIVADDRGRRRTSEETGIIKNYETFGYVVKADGSFEEVLLSMSNTQVKKMKRFNALIRSLTSRTTGKMLPEYAGCYKISTVPESNDKNSWFNYHIEFAGLTMTVKNGVMIYEKAKGFAEMVKNSEVKVNYDQE